MSLTSTIEWHSIDTIPHNKRIFVADLLDGVLVTAIAEISPISGETHIHAPGYPITGTKWWTHWAAFPEPPPFKVAARRERE
jgi:hypothetical protein